MINLWLFCITRNAPALPSSSFSQPQNLKSLVCNRVSQTSQPHTCPVCLSLQLLFCISFVQLGFGPSSADQEKIHRRIYLVSWLLCPHRCVPRGASGRSSPRQAAGQRGQLHGSDDAAAAAAVHAARPRPADVPAVAPDGDGVPLRRPGECPRSRSKPELCGQCLGVASTLRYCISKSWQR